MKKYFVPYELTIELFNIGLVIEPHNFAFYDKKELDIWSFCKLEMQDMNNLVAAPLISEAFDWFRNTHKIHSYIQLFEDGKFDYTHTSDKFIKEEDYGDGPFETFEEAQIGSLKKLIEIIKNTE